MKRLLLAACAAALFISTGAGAGIVANSASLWYNDCMTKSVANKSNFCWTLHSYINGTLQGGNPTGRGCTSHMASNGFGSDTVAENMCYWYFTDR